MTDAITLVLRSTDEARNRFRIGALRYAVSILRRLDEHRAADKIDKLEEQAELAKAVHGYHDCLVDYMQMTELPIFVHTRDHY